MLRLEDFKAMLGVKDINLWQADGRMFATIGETKLFVGQNTDLKKQTFIMKGKYDAYWLVNSKAQIVATI